MRVAVLSDFHLGARGRGCSFQHDEGSFLAWLERLERSHDRVVLLGDIFQTQHGLMPTRATAARHLRAALRRMPGLATRLRDPHYLYVHGNHDEIASHELGAASHASLRAPGPQGRRAVFIHGHQFDPVLARAPGAARAATWLTGQMRRLGFGPVAEFLEGRDISIKDHRFQGRPGPYATAALAMARQLSADFVVMGHTHVQRRHDLARTTYLNTGSCSRGARAFVSLDLGRGASSLHFDRPWNDARA